MTNEQSQIRDKEKSTPLLRINNVTLLVKHITTVKVESELGRLAIQVQGRSDPFVFIEDSPDKINSLFNNLADILLKTQEIVPFLFFRNVAIRFDLVSSIEREFTSVTIGNTALQTSESFAFETEEKAQAAFDDLMLRLGIGKSEPPKSDEPKETINKPSDSKQKKPPDKVPRRGRRN